MAKLLIIGGTGELGGQLIREVARWEYHQFDVHATYNKSKPEATGYH